MRNPIRYSSLIAATAFAVAACSGGGGGGGGGNTPPPNRPPTIGAVGNQSINQDTSTASISIPVADPESASGALTVSVSASDNVLLPPTGIVLAGDGASRTLTLTPAEAATGMTTVTVQARDPQGLTASRTFNLTVNGVSMSFTQFVNDTFPIVADETSRSLRGFSLDGDANDNDTVFDKFFQ